MKSRLVAILVAGFVTSAHCGQFTPQEQALLEKHLVAEVFRPNERSGHREVTALPPEAAQKRLLAEAEARYHSTAFFIHCFMNVAADEYNSSK
jgi:hypothetical protein